jgi:hypothetical protein
MGAIRGLLRFPLDRLERLLGTVFPAHWNPLLNLGALGFFFYWVITVSGISVSYTHLTLPTTPYV